MFEQIYVANYNDTMDRICNTLDNFFDETPDESCRASVCTHNMNNDDFYEVYNDRAIWTELVAIAETMTIDEYLIQQYLVA